MIQNNKLERMEKAEVLSQQWQETKDNNVLFHLVMG